MALLIIGMENNSKYFSSVLRINLQINTTQYVNKSIIPHHVERLGVRQGSLFSSTLFDSS